MKSPILLLTSRWPGNASLPEFGIAALDAQEHARPVQQHARLEALAHEARGLEHVHEADRAFEGDRVECDERLLSRACFDVLEDLLLIVDEKIAFLVLCFFDGGHAFVSLLAVCDATGPCIVHEPSFR